MLLPLREFFVMKVITTAKQLIAIPSFIRDDINEVGMADFLADCLWKKGAEVKKQYVKNDRYNVVGTFGTPLLWLCGHMDTVEPKNQRQLTPIVKGKRLYGLGSVDMKGGIASILTALESVKRVANIGILFYCGEEYDFDGMRTFLKEFNGKPDLAIFAEPTNLRICNAHRGILELKASIKGKTGHPSRPHEGINAIMGAVNAVKLLTDTLTQYATPSTGITTCTLSQIIGGTQVGFSGNAIVYSQGTNSIPDTVEIVLDIRPAKPEVNGEMVKRALVSAIQQGGCRLENILIRQDFGPLLPRLQKFTEVEYIVKSIVGEALYMNANDMGYGDGQLFFEKTNSPVIYFGPGPSSVSHQDGEYVDCSSLELCTEVFERIIRTYTRKQQLPDSSHHFS